MVKLVFNPGNYKYIIKHEKKSECEQLCKDIKEVYHLLKINWKKSMQLYTAIFFLIKIFVQNTPFSIWL